MNWSVLVDVGRVVGYVNIGLIPFGIVSQVVFYQAVRGTRLRYVAKSIFHAFLIGQLIIGPIMLLGYLISGDRLWSSFYVFNVIGMCWNLHVFRRDHNDDDDFWNGLGSRMKKMVRRRLRVLHPAHGVA